MECEFACRSSVLAAVQQQCRWSLLLMAQLVMASMASLRIQRRASSSSRECSSTLVAASRARQQHHHAGAVLERPVRSAARPEALRSGRAARAEVATGAPLRPRERLTRRHTSSDGVVEIHNIFFASLVALV